MVKIGMMISERYEILEKIGTGGMSDVYKGKDHKLNRFVAVKVLKQEFSENENFVSKFRIEAQAAAGLMHPNIVNVYDVGEESGMHYIVMELVEGITLKKYIEKKARLSYKEAVSIAIQVSMGIEAAHNNHIIHRDIKPQNIIISKDGKVKVTDFGIAKAATSNTITSNVMGSVHYTSPEQARGGYSDAKSDIYSLGITIFEMLTGRVPFNGETTVAIAIKHIQEEMPSPKEYVPEIPGSVESIVLKCCQKSPDRRYQDIQELIADLKQSLLNPDDDFVVVNDPDMDGGTRMISDNDMAQIKRHSAYHSEEEYEEEEEPLRLRSDTESLYEGEEEYEDGDDYDYDPKMEKVTTVLAVLGGIIICAIFIVVVWKIFGDREEAEGWDSPIISSETQTEELRVDMPVVTGKRVEDARSALTALGLLVEVAYVESETVPADEVISADVSVGSSIQTGSTVTLTVSAGTEGIEVPQVAGKTAEEATRELTSAGFLVNRTESNSDTVEKDYVISQMPESGNKAPRGTVITIEVSVGRGRVSVPKLIGLTEEEAVARAIEAQLEVSSVSYVYSSEVEVGQVCYQSYSYGSYVDPDTKIDLRVSKGKEAVTYRYSASITAPTVEEAPDYVSGTEVNVKLETDDGVVLLDTNTSSFPQSANYFGLTSAGGTITITYTVTTDGGTTVDPETGATINLPGSTESKSFTRRVEFTQDTTG
ncbi:MAG: Stk1 family PASTA domain-containing Ser/Thr kinase [Candidatus Gastranaerophilales bacterium]|nr:Stk1 family PASTA domain-containing Ser/Thr kinase [Candidatus Gastranaerophilales bacterium]